MKLNEARTLVEKSKKSKTAEKLERAKKVIKAQKIVEEVNTSKLNYGRICINKKLKTSGIIINHHQQNGVFRYSVYTAASIDESVNTNLPVKQSAWNVDAVELISDFDLMVKTGKNTMDYNVISKILCHLNDNLK